jgi:septum formation protein
LDVRPPFPSDFRLFVASQSPRRHSLLKDIGVPYQVVRSSADERVHGEAEAVALANAVAKVHHAALPADASEGVFVLGTDTVVTLAGKVMGKPASRVEAQEMIAALSGRTHQVISGVALARLGAQGLPTEVRRAAATTDVTFVEVDGPRIEAYLESGEWTDKAGAYGIQGLAATFVSEVRGEYSNVVGLPLCLLTRLFREAGFDLLLRQWI